MTEETKACIDARINYFVQYFTVPQNIEQRLKAFNNNIISLGETCATAAEFE